MILLSLLVVLFLSSCHKKEETKVTETNTSQSTMVLEDKTTETSKEPENPCPMLLAFGNKFLNFNSLKERNQSIKEYMTEKCQEENGINVDLDAKFRSVGKIIKVFQDTDSGNQYALLGEEDSRGVKNEVLFVVQLMEEDCQYKIDNFRYEQLHVH
ncbi:EF0163 family protein [Enterococcus hirae]|uniref:EF0163 family protein n=1 Tax=Enterococcus hirae TaxID=1354 RepID=UPI003100FBEB